MLVAMTTPTAAAEIERATDCCPPAAVGLERSDAQSLALVFKALGDPTRLRLLSMIASAPDAEACICDMTDPVGLSQPTVSHHMSVLTSAGLVTREQRGRWAYFALAEGARTTLHAAVTTVTRQGLGS